MSEHSRKKQTLPLAALALVGLVILLGDIHADVVFFSEFETLPGAMVASAVVRNLLTLAAIVALFVHRRVGAYLLLIAAGLGMWRRMSYLGPLLGVDDPTVSLLVHSGADLVFRALLLGVGLGWFLAKGGKGS